MSTVCVNMHETTYNVASSGSNVRIQGTGSALELVTVYWPVGSIASTYTPSSKSAIIFVSHTEFNQLCAQLLNGLVEVIVCYNDAQSGSPKTITSYQFNQEPSLRATSVEQRVATIEQSVLRIEHALSEFQNQLPQ